MSFKLSAQSSPRSAQSFPRFGQTGLSQQRQGLQTRMRYRWKALSLAIRFMQASMWYRARRRRCTAKSMQRSREWWSWAESNARLARLHVYRPGSRCRFYYRGRSSDNFKNLLQKIWLDFVLDFWSCLMINLACETNGKNEICLSVRFFLVLKGLRLVPIDCSWDSGHSLSSSFDV